MRSVLAIVNVLGALLALFAGYHLLPVCTALFYGETAELRVFLACAGITLVTGLALLLATRRFRAELKPRDAYMLVSLSWLAISAAGALPLFFAVPDMSVTDAYFEAVSGLSTTGSTVMNGLDALPRSINLWRHALHWLGGMGIIVLAVAILPLLGVGGMQMYRAEIPGPVKDTKLTPRITGTAKALWLVYAGLTAACFLALLATGMAPFDALCHAFSVLALGGFSTHDDSIGHFDSAAVEAVVITFMLVSAVNFSTHFVAMRRGTPAAYLRDPEARWVMAWIVMGVALVTAALWGAGYHESSLQTLRHAAFNTVSMATTAGFSTQDFGQWPTFAAMWMLFLSCLVCSTGSTGGGIKMFRTLTMMKQAGREMFQLVHPQAVQPLKIGGQVVADRVAYSVLAFIFVYFMTVVALTFAMLATGLDFITAFTAVVASVNNAGPGLGQVGPASSFSVLTDPQTWICTLAMFLGRIELFTFLILFTRAFWRK